MRNIYKCTKRRFGSLYCAFMKIQENDKGEIEEIGCSLKMKDEYHIYPEHDDNGDVIINRVSESDPFPPGVSIIWESDSPHDTGLTFSCRRIRLEEYNMHPLYSIHEMNDPFVTGTMGYDHMGYSFGLNNVSITPSGWLTQKILGIQRVEDCNMAIYGPYNKIEKMIIPKCLRDYTGEIKDWINYTAIKDNKNKKSFFVCNSTDEEIAEFCFKTLQLNKANIVAIYQILIAMKHGEYVNLWDALINNGLSREKTAAFMRIVSTKSKKNLYTSMNLQKYYLYWNALDRMNLPSEKVYLYRCHLLNYLLNYPPLQKLNPKKEVYLDTYPPNKRYWWIAMIVEDAIRLSDSKKKSHAKPFITNEKIAWFKKLLEKTKSQSFEETVNPAIETLSSIIKENKNSQHVKRQVRVFSRIVLAGKRWSTNEIRITWYYFQKAYTRKKPEYFWQYIEMVKGATPNVLCSIKNEAGIFDDDVNFSEQKAFAHHLLEARKSNTSFMVDKPELAERWNTITPKQFSNNIDDKEKIDKHDIFWNELSKIKLKGKNKTNYILQTICENCSDIDKIDANSLAIMYQDELNEDIMIGINIDSDDINRHGIIQIEDIDENEEGGEEWQDSESPN